MAQLSDSTCSEAAARPHDLKIKATLTLEAGDGTRIVEVAVDQILPEVFNPNLLRHAATSIRDALRFNLEAPARAMVLAYVGNLRESRYPRGHRLDEPPEDSEWLPMDEAGHALVDAVFERVLRDHDSGVPS